MMFEDNEIDVDCAFQMLEHLSYQQALQSMTEMASVARKGLVISLPHAKEFGLCRYVFQKLAQ